MKTTPDYTEARSAVERILPSIAQGGEFKEQVETSVGTLKVSQITGNFVSIMPETTGYYTEAGNYTEVNGAGFTVGSDSEYVTDLFVKVMRRQRRVNNVLEARRAANA